MKELIENLRSESHMTQFDGYDATLATANEAADKLEILANAVMSVIHATRDYLPPDGITAKDCISRVLDATDNLEVWEIMKEFEDSQ